MGRAGYTLDEARADAASFLAAEQAFLPMPPVEVNVLDEEYLWAPFSPGGTILAGYNGWSGGVPFVDVGTAAMRGRTPANAAARRREMGTLRAVAAGDPGLIGWMEPDRRERAAGLAAAFLSGPRRPHTAVRSGRSPRTRLERAVLHETAHHRAYQAGWGKGGLDDAWLHEWLAATAGTPPTLYAAWAGGTEWLCEAWALWRAGVGMPGGNADAMEEAAACWRAGTRPGGV